MFNKKLEKEIEVSTLPKNVVNEATYVILQQNPNYASHSYFKYPCKFIPEIPRWAIKKYLNEDGEVIFDPFSGSGTTLLEGILNGYDSYGTEIDDIAKLLIKVKTRPFNHEELLETRVALKTIIDNIDNPDIAPKIAHINNLTHWFTQESIERMGRIRSQIENISNDKISDFLSVCFAAIIKKCSFADSVSPKPYVSTKVIKTPYDVKVEFLNTSTKYLKLMQELMTYNIINKAEIVDGDALNVKVDLNVNLAITSPPYINAFDYGRTLRLENLWLGFLSETELRSKKNEYVGTEQVKVSEEIEDISILEKSSLLKSYFYRILELDKKRAVIVKRFFGDMERNLKEMYKLLVPNGIYCLVIGNSTIRKVEIESWKIIRDIATKNGFKEVENFSYVIKNPYIRIPRSGRGGKINKDYVLVLQKIGGKDGPKRS